MMSTLKEEFNKLKEIDVYSMMLFVLFKLRDIPEYSTLSELAYVLDKDSFLKLSEYFGGLTIKIPTIEELESVVYSLILYQYIDIDGHSDQEAISLISEQADNMTKIRQDYRKIKTVLSNYNFTRGSKYESTNV